MVRSAKGRDTLVNELEGDVGVESDCEDGSPEFKDEVLRKEQTRAVLTTGSFSAYVHFISPACVEREMTVPQLEISFLLPLYGHDPVRSPQIARPRLSLGIHSPKDGNGGATSMLAKECIRPVQPSETTAFNRDSHVWH